MVLAAVDAPKALRAVLSFVGSTMAPDDCRLPEIITTFGLIFQVMTYGISYGNYSQCRHTAD